ncbi:MAG TPA: ABATE domain-containing protein [Actinomycetota bacterium]|nr:ABATE domain-containing protein [Actinomycetota bacterium]
MNERDKRRVGEQIEPGGRPKAPGRLELLQRFVNTWNHEFPEEWDRIGDPARARAWLSEKGLIRPTDRVTRTDVVRLRRFRETIRSLALANHHDRAPVATSLEPLRREAANTRLGLTVDAAGSTSIHGSGPGVDGAIGTLLAILHEAELLGAWPRMKGCRQCEYVFFDRSKNRSAAWCAMSICGNRSKNRTYRRRRTPG